MHEKVPAACLAKNVPPPAFGGGGGYALVVSGDRAAKALEVVVEACRLAGADDKVALSLECGAHALVAKSDADDDDEKSPAYDVEAFAYGDASFSKSGAEMVEDYAALLAAFPVDTLEDPFAEHDVDAFVQLKDRLDAAANGDASAGPPPKKRGPVGGAVRMASSAPSHAAAVAATPSVRSCASAPCASRSTRPLRAASSTCRPPASISSAAARSPSPPSPPVTACTPRVDSAPARPDGAARERSRTTHCLLSLHASSGSAASCARRRRRSL